MRKKISKLFHIKFIRWVLVPVLLFLLWAIATIDYVIFYNKGFLALSYPENQQSFKHVLYTRLLKGEKLDGEFTAEENYLGIVQIRFQQFLRIPYNDEDTLIFRIKEKGATKWYYQNKYKSGLTFDTPFLPFGFPIIVDSKGKTYDFEVESLHGNNKNGVELSPRQPNLESKYKFPRKITKDKRYFSVFLIKKVYTSLLTVDIPFSAFIYLLPLIFYLFYLTPFTMSYLILLQVLVFADAIFFQIDNDSLYLVTPGIWMVLLAIEERSSIYSFITGILFIILTVGAYTVNNVPMALEASSWAFGFFTAGFLQILYESLVK